MHEWLKPLHDAEGMRSIDAWAIEDQGVPSLQLMEAAGAALAEAVIGLTPSGPIRVACGKGNNGGDGLVCARLLRTRGFEAEALMLWPVAELSTDAAAMLERLGAGAREVEAGDVAGALQGSGAIVDAVFGTGFEGEAREPAAAAIAAINGAAAPVVAADIASGVSGSTGQVDGAAVSADVTVSFHAPKLGHLIAPGKQRTGRLEVAPIGIPGGAPARPAGGVIGVDALRALPARDAGSSKFTSGRVVLAGGSRGMTGAIALASTAAMRAGAGYATAAVPADLEPILEAKLTEVMTKAIPSEAGAFGPGADEDILAAAEGAGALVLGPGIGRSDGARAAALAVAQAAPVSLLIDADGLFALAGKLEVLSDRSAPAILTPHAGELGRLLGRTSDEVQAERLASARDAAARGRCVVVLKGDDTLVVDGRDPEAPAAVNALSAPALATAGTGDVLSGVIGALLARGLDPFHAACAGVLAHARAGTFAARRIGTTDSVIASDVIDGLPEGLSP